MVKLAVLIGLERSHQITYLEMQLEIFQTPPVGVGGHLAGGSQKSIWSDHAPEPVDHRRRCRSDLFANGVLSLSLSSWLQFRGFDFLFLTVGVVSVME